MELLEKRLSWTIPCEKNIFLLCSIRNYMMSFAGISYAFSSYYTKYEIAIISGLWWT